MKITIPFILIAAFAYGTSQALAQQDDTLTRLKKQREEELKAPPTVEATTHDTVIHFTTYGVVTSNDGSAEGVNQAGGSQMSFDPNGLPIGPWRNVSTEGHIMHMLLIQDSGMTTKRFIFGFSGAISGESGKILSFYGSTITLANEEGVMTIVNNEIVDGTLNLTASDGQIFTIYDLNPGAGKIRLTQNSPALMGQTTESQNNSTLVGETTESQQMIKIKQKMDEDMKRLFPDKDQNAATSNVNATTNPPSVKTNGISQGITNAPKQPN